MGEIQKVKKLAVIGSVATAGVLLGMISGGAVAQMSAPGMHQPTAEQTGEFHRIEQPLWVKAGVTAGGLALMGLELWWFLFSKPKSRQPTTP